MNKDFETISSEEKTMRKKETLNSLAIPQAKMQISGSYIKEIEIAPFEIGAVPETIITPPMTTQEPMQTEEATVLNEEINIPVVDQKPLVEDITASLNNEGTNETINITSTEDEFEKLINDTKTALEEVVEMFVVEAKEKLKEIEAAKKIQNDLHMQQKAIIEKNAVQAGLNPSSLETPLQNDLQQQDAPVMPEVPEITIPPVNQSPSSFTM